MAALNDADHTMSFDVAQLEDEPPIRKFRKVDGINIGRNCSQLVTCMYAATRRKHIETLSANLRKPPSTSLQRDQKRIPREDKKSHERKTTADLPMMADSDTVQARPSWAQRGALSILSE